LLVRVEDAGGWKRKLRVGVPEAAVDKRFEELLEKLAGRVEMPGFRKGKVPRDMLLQRYAQALRADAIEELIASAYV
jgi:trigger factor